jgi:hypothetical protein
MELSEKNFRTATPTSPIGITGAEVDENIRMALRAISLNLSAPLDHEAVAADPFVEELSSWIKARLVTTEGVELSRDEFRRRLECEKARYAGRAESSKVSEAADRLKRAVLG